MSICASDLGGACLLGPVTTRWHGSRGPVHSGRVEFVSERTGSFQRLKWLGDSGSHACAQAPRTQAREHPPCMIVFKHAAMLLWQHLCCIRPARRDLSASDRKRAAALGSVWHQRGKLTQALLEIKKRGKPGFWPAAGGHGCAAGAAR